MEQQPKFPRIVADPENPRIELLEGSRIVPLPIFARSYHEIELEYLGLEDTVIQEADAIRVKHGLGPMFSAATPNTHNPQGAA